MNTIFLKKGKPLDKYKSSVVAGFSYYQLFSSSKNCVEVRRSSDNATQVFGFKNGYIDSASILAFCGASSGYVKTWYNQFIGGNHAIQTVSGNQPRIVNSGVFEGNGIRFISTNNTTMIINNYSAINFSTPPISIYQNIYIETNVSAFFMCCSRNLTINDPVLGNYYQGTPTNNVHYLSNGFGTFSTLIPPIGDKLMHSFDGVNRYIITSTSNNTSAKMITTFNSYNRWTMGNVDTSGGFLGAYALNGNIKTSLIFNNIITNQSNYNYISSKC